MAVRRNRGGQTAMVARCSQSGLAQPRRSGATKVVRRNLAVWSSQCGPL